MPLCKIAVISDTHDMLRPELIDALRTVDFVLHAGDITGRNVIERLDEAASVTAVVRGNCDRGWAWELPAETILDLCGKKVCLIHDKMQISAAGKRADIIIFGHTHKYEETYLNGQLWLNPGSCGPQRFGRPATMAVLEIDSETGSAHVRKVELSGNAAGAEYGEMTGDRAQGLRSGEAGLSGTAAGAGHRETPGDRAQDLRSGEKRQGGQELRRRELPDAANPDLQKITAAVVHDLEKGRTVERIIKTNKISRELTEQICQIYFTHPGIDVQGVLDRMELLGYI